MWEAVSIGFCFLTNIIGVAVVWGKTMEKIERLDEDVSRLRNGLWRGNGTSIYVTDKEHARAYQNLKEDIQEIKDMMLRQFAQFREEIERQAEKNSEEFKKISNFMGRVEQFLLEHRE